MCPLGHQLAEAAPCSPREQEHKLVPALKGRIQLDDVLPVLVLPEGLQFGFEYLLSIFRSACENLKRELACAPRGTRALLEC